MFNKIYRPSWIIRLFFFFLHVRSSLCVFFLTIFPIFHGSKIYMGHYDDVDYFFICIHSVKVNVKTIMIYSLSVRMDGRHFPPTRSYPFIFSTTRQRHSLLLGAQRLLPLPSIRPHLTTSLAPESRRVVAQTTSGHADATRQALSLMTSMQNNGEVAAAVQMSFAQGTSHQHAVELHACATEPASLPRWMLHQVGERSFV